MAPGEPGRITADAPPGIAGGPLLTQVWLDLAFVHWAVPPSAVAPLLPPGVRPDTLHGVTYVGLVAFRMHRVGWFRLPGVPYLGTFPETNVRLYSVDGHGRRGVVFRGRGRRRGRPGPARSTGQRPVLPGRPGPLRPPAPPRGHPDPLTRRGSAGRVGGAARRVWGSRDGLARGR